MSHVRTLLNSTDFLHSLNEHDNEQTTEQDSDQEGVDSIPDLIFDEDGHLNGYYERVDGLVAYLDSGTFETHSLNPLHQPRQSGISEREARIRSALRIRRSILLVTSAQETEERNSSTAHLFTKWSPLVPQHLEAQPSLVHLLSEKQQERWNAANIELSVLGSGGSIPGVLGLIRSLLLPQDIVGLYMARPRQLHVKPDAARESIYRLESELFSTVKYSQYSTYFTVITYGRGDCGVVELYEVTPDTRGLASSITPVAAARAVPKMMLRSLKDQPRKIELLQTSNRIRFSCTAEQPAPVLARVETRRPQEPQVEWRRLGQAWRRALRTAEHTSHEGLVATIPQMMAFLHLNGSGLHAMASTAIHDFSVPLTCRASGGTMPSSAAGLQVKRCIEITEGPEGEAHRLDRVKVAVMFPHDCRWAHERLLWV